MKAQSKKFFSKKEDSSGTVDKSITYYAVQAIIYLVVGIFALSTVLPFLYVIAGSFATEKQLTQQSFFLFPYPISLNAFRYILRTGDIFRGLKNSLIVTVGGTAIAMAITTSFAYSLSRADLKGRNFLLNMVIITMIFSGGMIPSYLVISNLGLLDTFWAIMLPGALSAYNMIIMKNFFQGIPVELEEAATLDGANDLGIFLRIILPLSTASIASISLFYAVSLWNNYFNAMLYISSPSKEVSQVVLRRIALLAGGISTDGTDLEYGMFGAPPHKAVKMATTVVATIPILMVYPFIQKYFTKGVMIGAVKG